MSYQPFYNSYRSKALPLKVVIFFLKNGGRTVWFHTEGWETGISLQIL